MNSSGNETKHNKTTSNINELVLHFRICEWKNCENVKSFSGYWKSEIQQRYLIKNAGKTDTTGQKGTGGQRGHDRTSGVVRGKSVSSIL